MMQFISRGSTCFNLFKTPTIVEHLFDIFNVFYSNLYLKSFLKIKFVNSFYVDIIDVERKDVLSFIRHLRGHIFIFIFV